MDVNKEFLDYAGLGYYDEQLKKYIKNLGGGDMYKSAFATIKPNDGYVDKAVNADQLGGVAASSYATQDDISGFVNESDLGALAKKDSLGKADVGLGNVDNKSSETIRGEITLANVTTALGYTPMDSTLKGSNNGVAELDSSGKVPSSQLPSYVDDVLEYAAKTSFPTTGETGKIYVDTSKNLTYRWGGTDYVEISPSLALGETSSTAYRGDRGKTAYSHSQIKNGNPHNVTASDVGLGNVGNFKAVSTVASQGLTDTEKSNARANIGAGTSSFSGSYNDLSDTPTVITGGSQTSSSSADGGSNVYTFTKSDGTTSKLTVKNGNKGSDGAVGSSLWTTTVAPTTPNYTFNISNLVSINALTTPRVGDVILYSYYRYTITSVSDSTVLAPARVSIRGSAGTAATISIGTVTTGAAGTAASVTNSGTTSAAIFDIVIPKGDKGDPGTNATTTAVVSTSANGLAPKVTDTSKFLKGDGTWATPTNTKNTAGTTDKTDTKLFLAGATAQSANPTTYSNSKVYIGTDNELYSNGKKVAHAEDVGDVRGWFLGQYPYATYSTIESLVKAFFDNLQAESASSFWGKHLVGRLEWQGNTWVNVNVDVVDRTWILGTITTNTMSYQVCRIGLGAADAIRPLVDNNKVVLDRVNYANINYDGDGYNLYVDVNGQNRYSLHFNDIGMYMYKTVEGENWQKIWSSETYMSYSETEPMATPYTTWIGTAR